MQDEVALGDEQFEKYYASLLKQKKEAADVAVAAYAALLTQAELQALLDDPETAAASTKIQAVYRGRVSRARKQTGDIDGDGDKEITAAEIEASDVDDETKEKLQEIAKAAEEGGEALTTQLAAEVMPDLEGHTDLSATKIQAAYRGRKARADKAKAGGDERLFGRVPDANEIDLDFDLVIISTRIHAARNLSMFPLNPGGSKETRVANAEDFYRERAKQLSSENTAIADTLLEVTLTLLEEVRTAKLGRDIAERGVEFWRSQPRGTGDGRDLELFTHE